MFETIKKTVAPPYNAGDLYSIFIAFFIMVAIPLTVLQVTNSRDNRSSASIFDNSTTNLNTDIRVSISSPNNSATVSGTTSVSVEASDNTDTISQVIITSADKTLATINNPSASTKFTASFSWDTTKEKNGAVSLVATAVNSKNQKNNSDTINLNISNTDSTPPSISFNQPNDGAYLSGANYFVKINADDDLGLASIDLSLDGKSIKVFSKAPYELLLDLSSVKAGNHKLSAKAVDLFGNVADSSIEFYRGVKSIGN